MTRREERAPFPECEDSTVVGSSTSVIFPMREVPVACLGHEAPTMGLAPGRTPLPQQTTRMTSRAMVIFDAIREIRRPVIFQGGYGRSRKKPPSWSSFLFLVNTRAPCQQRPGSIMKLSNDAGGCGSLRERNMKTSRCWSRCWSRHCSPSKLRLANVRAAPRYMAVCLLDGLYCIYFVHAYQPSSPGFAAIDIRGFAARVLRRPCFWISNDKCAITFR